MGEIQNQVKHYQSIYTQRKLLNLMKGQVKHLENLVS